MPATDSDALRQTKTDLSASLQRLVDVMHDLRFGLVEDLIIRNGEPVFDPAPRVLRDIKIGSADTARSGLTSVDFELKDQVIELFEHLERLENGTVELLEVRYGLPVRLVVRQTH